MITRREFITRSGALMAVAPSAAIALTQQLRAAAPSQAIPEAIMRRIGVTTVCFRDWFPSTRTGGRPQPPGGDLTLLDAPKFIADRVGIHNVEVWNSHFADESIEYCRQLREAAKAAGSVITNVQLDGQYDLSSPDAAQRAESIEHVKRWMDRAAAVGAPRMRANTGGRRGDPVGEQTIDAFRQLAAYGRTIDVTILVENHVGMSVDIPKVVEVVRRVNDPLCRALADWGNTPSDSPQARVVALAEMAPYLEFVSAKQVDFDANNRHVSYDVAPLITATEQSGYRGIYSIEMWGQQPPDPVAAVAAFRDLLAANIRA